MLKKIDHIGLAVHSLEQARRFYEEVLGLTCEKVEEVPSQQVRVAFFKVGEIQLELLEPTGPESPIARFLASRGEGVHHISYAVDGLKQRLSELQEKGCRLINETPQPGAGGKKIAFLHPQSSFGVLTELAEEKEG